jgi:hypothetical protein
MEIKKRFITITFGFLAILPACSDDSEVKEKAASLATEADKEKNSGSKCGEAPAALALAETYTYHSASVQGQLGFCGGCHSGPGTNANIDFTDYDRMLSTFSTQSISLSKIVMQVESNHQGSKSDEALTIFNGWAGNSFARGTPDGNVDESPFYDENNNGDPLDFGDFDPLAGNDTTSGSADCQ